MPDETTAEQRLQVGVIGLADSVVLRPQAHMPASSVNFDSSIPSFRWDEASFADRLDSEGEAKRDAAHGEPRDGANGCPFLTAVRSEAENVARAAGGELSRCHQAEIDGAAPRLYADAELRRERDEVLADMAQTCRSGINVTTPLVEAVTTARAEYTDFTVEHGLVGKAAQELNRQWVWWVVGGAFLELVLNAWTLGTAHKDGFAGVIPEMSMFTAINVIAGLVIAYGLRQKNHHAKFRGKRIVGWLWVVMALLLVPLVNFVFGHYRDALLDLKQSDILDYLERWVTLFPKALETAFSSEGWVPKSMQSVALIFGGVFMAGLVAYKRYQSDDPYPGFGKLSRKRNAAQVRYREAVQEITDEIKARADDGARVFSNIATGCAAAPALAAEIRIKFESWGNAYRNLVGDINIAGRKQLDSYRQTNRNLKVWPQSLDAAFDGFELDSDLAAPPQAPVLPELQEQDIGPLLERSNEIVSTARRRYQSEVFAPLSALDPNDQNHLQYANPVGKENEIGRVIDHMVQSADRLP